MKGSPRYVTAEELAGRRILEEVQKIAQDELEFRRRWAAYIREEFEKYHEHSADGGECGSCGAIQGANWMDPDYLTDGPRAEPFGTWKDRQP